MNSISRCEGNIDRLVYNAYFCNTREMGVFVDIGAARPDFLSISDYYRKLGWRVIAVEANPVFASLQVQAGHETYQYACGNHDEDGVDFCVVDSHGINYQEGCVSYEAFSSLAVKSEYVALTHKLDMKTIKVNMRRLDTILKQHTPDIGAIDIVSINVEGWEIEVLQGFSLQQYKPKILIIENYFNSREYRDYLSRAGYKRWRRIPPNDIYVVGDMGAPVPVKDFMSDIGLEILHACSRSVASKLAAIRRHFA